MNKPGFGFLRLPKKGDEFDWDTIDQMVDAFMAGGGNFYDGFRPVNFHIETIEEEP